MTHDGERLTITGGMDVLGTDGEKVGTVAGMRGDYVVVSKGFFFPTDYYIPTSAISTVSDGNAYLSVTRDEALDQGWDVEPVDAEVDEFDQPIIDAGLHIDNPVPVDRVADDEPLEGAGQPFEHQADVDHRDSSDTIEVALTEEELTARTHEVERGSVRVDKVVTSEEQALEVPVTEERVHINRRQVDRDLAPGEQTLGEGTFEVPVHGEEVEVTKEPHVREVVEISKEATTETQRVEGTVRREEVRVTDDSGTVDDNTARH